MNVSDTHEEEIFVDVKLNFTNSELKSIDVMVETESGLSISLIPMFVPLGTARMTTEDGQVKDVLTDLVVY